MAWFLYGDQKSRRCRKGIWLRVRALSDEVKKAIKKKKCMRPSDTIEWVTVLELREKNQVLLEIWCKSLVDSLRDKDRHIVFHVLVDEDDEWVCESDLGRGLVGGGK